MRVDGGPDLKDCKLGLVHDYTVKEREDGKFACSAEGIVLTVLQETRRGPCSSVMINSSMTENGIMEEERRRTNTPPARLARPAGRTASQRRRPGGFAWAW